MTCCFNHGFTVSIVGNIVSEADCFFEDTYICPDGYTAVRKFPSILGESFGKYTYLFLMFRFTGFLSIKLIVFVKRVSDPSVQMSYKMEVLQDPATIGLPLFRVTSENGEKVPYNLVLGNHIIANSKHLLPYVVEVNFFIPSLWHHNINLWSYDYFSPIWFDPLWPLLDHEIWVRRLFMISQPDNHFLKKVIIIHLTICPILLTMHHTCL